MSATDRPAAWWLSYADTDPEPDSARPSVAYSDTVPAPPPSAGRYAWVDPARRAAPPPAPASRVRATVRPSAKTDPCIVPPPGSDRRGAAGLVRVVEVDLATQGARRG